MKNYNTILTEKQQKYQYYRQVKLININILQVKYYYTSLLSGQSRITKQTKFTYSPLGKGFEKQIKSIEEQGKIQVKVLELLNPITRKLTIKDAISENKLSEKAKNELNKIQEI